MNYYLEWKVVFEQMTHYKYHICFFVFLSHEELYWKMVLRSLKVRSLVVSDIRLEIKSGH